MFQTNFYPKLDPKMKLGRISKLLHFSINVCCIFSDHSINTVDYFAIHREQYMVYTKYIPSPTSQ